MIHQTKLRDRTNYFVCYPSLEQFFGCVYHFLFKGMIMFLRLDFENYQNDNCVFEYGEIDS